MEFMWIKLAILFSGGMILNCVGYRIDQVIPYWRPDVASFLISQPQDQYLILNQKIRLPKQLPSPTLYFLKSLTYQHPTHQILLLLTMLMFVVLAPNNNEK